MTDRKLIGRMFEGEVSRAEQAYLECIKQVESIHKKEQELKLALAMAILKLNTYDNAGKRKPDCGVKGKNIAVLDLIKRGEGKVEDYTYKTSTGKTVEINIKFIITARIQQGLDKTWYNGMGLPPVNEMHRIWVNEYGVAKMLYEAGYNLCGGSALDNGTIDCHYEGVCYSKDLDPNTVYAIRKEGK
jgi:hypothetical protein